MVSVFLAFHNQCSIIFKDSNIFEFGHYQAVHPPRLTPTHSHSPPPTQHNVPTYPHSPLFTQNNVPYTPAHPHPRKIISHPPKITHTHSK